MSGVRNVLKETREEFLKRVSEADEIQAEYERFLDEEDVRYEEAQREREEVEKLEEAKQRQQLEHQLKITRMQNVIALRREIACRRNGIARVREWIHDNHAKLARWYRIYEQRRVIFGAVRPTDREYCRAYYRALNNMNDASSVIYNTHRTIERQTRDIQHYEAELRVIEQSTPILE